MSVIEEYKCVAVSTMHLTNSDRSYLEALAHNREQNMVMSRRTGWLIKLYEDVEQNDDALFSDRLVLIIRWAHHYGYRMIELDEAAPVLPWFDRYES